MIIAIVIEAIPPYCGGAEQVAWIHAVEMAKHHKVSVITLGPDRARTIKDGVEVHWLPTKKRLLTAYCTSSRRVLNDCLDEIRPDVIHCHMPNILSACLQNKGRLMVTTIHDGTPENELIQLNSMPKAKWLKFKAVRRVNISKSDIVTCVSKHNRDLMRKLYPRYASKFTFIPNPIYDRFFSPVTTLDDGYVLNFGRQVDLKMGALIEVARRMPETRFVFVGTGEMVQDYGLKNVNFVGFTEKVEEYIDGASLCVFPSRSENFPLAGLEAMARGKAVIATHRGFSEYIQHLQNGWLLESPEPVVVEQAIRSLIKNSDLRETLGRNARVTAEQYHPSHIMAKYEKMYEVALSGSIFEAVRSGDI